MNRKQMALLLGLSLALGQTAFAADHVAVVEKNGKQGVIDQGGKEILPLDYKKILVGDPKEDPVILVQQKGRYGLYDRDGKQLLAPTLKKSPISMKGSSEAWQRKMELLHPPGRKAARGVRRSPGVPGRAGGGEAPGQMGLCGQNWQSGDPAPVQGSPQLQ